MPVYNTNEMYLRQAIESVLNQTYSNFEFIIVNDAPLDEARVYSIVAGYNDTRIIWLPSIINSGIAAASNLGINYAQGEFIAMLDHDDICVANRFAQQVEFLTVYPEYGFVGSQAIAFYADQSTVELNYPFSSSLIELKKSFFITVPFLNPSIMFRRSALGDLRYNPHYKVCADYDLFARLVFMHNIMATNLPEPLLYYRFHDTNTSLTQYLVAEQETNAIQNWILQMWHPPV